ncbi:MAG: tRNA preQ1(34) S-adenosylmethionine ribosyltransferase-isomerase QueA [Actinobacteria bacterium]|nr:MAG: tRNA preQ1(34) S-adenosylmethionine ribosyltransferase-isomerase QueA [Actinomycetota bacterium]
MHISDIDYDLPHELIAQHPIEPRDSARLLVDGVGAKPSHHLVSDLVNFVRPDDVLVVNHTRVMPARVKLHRTTGGSVEALLLEQRDASLGLWETLLRPGGKLNIGEILTTQDGLEFLQVGERTLAGDTFVVKIFGTDVQAKLAQYGSMPLPPYITAPLEDVERYQTVFSHDQKSAAAPTAGLHFTPQLLQRIRDQGTQICEVELVVGLDTFKPISDDNPLNHMIHSESYCVPQQTMDACLKAHDNGGRVIAVGTTATRALESASTLHELQGRTNLFITPGYEWKMVDVMMTNFHMPRTTLLLMIESFVGKRWRSLYEEAIRERYRMLSFGDAMLLYLQPN